MTFSANMGAERPQTPSREGTPRQDESLPPLRERNRRGQSRPESHDPEAKELLRRYLSEIHSYRELGNVALRDLEQRLVLLAGEEAGQQAPSSAGPVSAPVMRAPSQEGAPGNVDSPKLTERLKELSEYLHEDLTRVTSTQPSFVGRAADPASRPFLLNENVLESDRADTPAPEPRPRPSHKPTPNAPVLDRSWFEERFATMRASMDELADRIPTKRIEALEAQFHQLMTKLDAREKDRSIDKDRSMVAVEAGLKKLAAYLDDNKQWTKSQDMRFRGVEERLDRLSGLVAQSHAALSATAKGLELVAKAAGPELAEKTADIVAGKLEPRLDTLDQKQAIVELGGEVARLSAQSKHFARSSDERLKQLQSSLDESLDRMDEYAQASEAQPASHRWHGERKDSAVEDDYDGKMIAAARKAARLADGPAQDFPGEGEPLRYQIPYGEFLPEDERTNSRVGLVVAAVILLLASVAMLYLNLRDSGVEGKLSSAWLSLSAPTKKDASKLHTGSIEAVPVKTEIIQPDAPSGGEQVRLPENPLLASVASPEHEAGAAATDRLPVNRTGKTASLRTAAVAGDAAAQFSVGEIYLEGRNLDSSVPVEERLSKAARWFRRAAEKGHAPSQYRLATLYELGQGAPKDHARAMGWYRRAAESGHVKAMHNLAVLSVMTDSAPRDYADAASWFEKAAAHGLRDSQYNLGLLYERGLGVEKDAAKAYRWFSLAAKAGDTNARSKQTRLAEALSRQEREQADRETTSWSAVEMDMATNSKAPEPPVRKSREAEAVTEPKRPRPQLMESSWSPQIAALDEAVIKAQRLLAKLGYNPGPVDGILGPKTMAAIRAFETKSGLPGTGKPTEALISKLSGSLSI